MTVNKGSEELQAPLNLKRVASVLKTVTDTGNRQEFVLSRAIEESMPEYINIPNGVKRGSKEHAIFIYFATLLDFRGNSGHMYPYVKKIFEENPNLFYRQGLIEKGSDGIYVISKEDIVELLRGLPNSKQGAHHWDIAGRSLFEIYGGKPETILQVPNLLSIVRHRSKKKRELGLTGWGPKLISLLVKHFVQFGIIPYDKSLQEYYPVDLHTLQLFLNTESLTPNEGVTDGAGLAEKVRQEITKLMVMRKINPFATSELMWMFGKYGCGACKRSGEKNPNCPFYNKCIGPVDMSKYHFTGDITR